MNTRHYIILNTTELSNINFEEVLETSPATVRRSVNGTKTFVKWIGDNIPKSVQNLQTKEGPYTHDEILNILQTSEWTDSNNLLVTNET